MTKRDYYQILGVDRRATADEIRRAYRKLARKYHPDVNKSADAAEHFAEVSEANEVLSDAEKRKVYDQFGHAGVNASAAGEGGFRPGGFGAQGWGAGGDRSDVSSADFGAIFEQMFGGGIRGGAPFGAQQAARPPAVRRGRDMEHPLHVSFMTALQGGEEHLRFTVNGKPQTIAVKIPPCIDTGAKLRVQGKGQPGQHGGAPGDLILEVEVGAHPWFRREGLDVSMDLPISIAEAALGATVSIPLPRGEATLKVPAGASSGRRLRLRGKGGRGAGGKEGDFYAVIQIVGPTDLSDRGRELLEDLRGELKNPRESGPWSDGEDG
jgi:DnaJ-class molecular chaperone